MASDEDVMITFQASVILGKVVGGTLTPFEKLFLEAIRVTEEQKVEQPENQSVDIMLHLLNSAKQLIDAHKTIIAWVDLHRDGKLRHEGSDKIQ